MVKELDCSCRILLKNNVKKMQTFTIFTLPYLTLMENLQLWLQIRMPKPRSGETGSLSQPEPQIFLRLIMQGGDAYGSARNSVKASNLPVSNVRRVSHSKTSYTKYTLATQNIKRMKAFASFKNEV